MFSENAVQPRHFAYHARTHERPESYKVTMPLTELNHYFVRSKDLERSRDFYCGALGFEVMPRPKFPFPGYWFGIAGKVQIHLGLDGIPEAASYYLGSSPDSAKDNAGVIDHIAFEGTHPENLAQTLRKQGFDTTTRYFSEFKFAQIFVADPDGLMIELNFPNIATEPDWAPTPD